MAEDATDLLDMICRRMVKLTCVETREIVNV